MIVLAIGRNVKNVTAEKSINAQSKTVVLNCGT